MNKKIQQKSITTNALMNALLSISSFIFPLITFPYVSRVLGPESIGKVSLALTIIDYFLIISQFGIPFYAIRECAKVRDDKEKLSRVTHEIFILNMIFTIISYILLAITIYLVPQLREEKMLYFVVAFTIILSTIGMEWLFKAKEEYSYITIRSVVFKFISIILMFILVHSESDYVLYGMTTVIAAAGSCIMNLIQARKIISFKNVGNYNVFKHVKHVIIFFIIAVCWIRYDKAILGFVCGNEELGYYEVGSKFLSIANALIISLSNVILPRLSYFEKKGASKQINAILNKSFQIMIIFSISIVVYIIAFSKQCVLFIAGDQFENSIMPLNILIVVVLINGIANYILYQLLIPKGREKTGALLLVITVCVGIPLNIILANYFLSIGSAIAYLTSKILLTLLYSCSCRKKMLELVNNINFVNLILAILCGLLLSFWTVLLPLQNYIIVIISLLLYCIGYFGILVLRKEATAVALWKWALNIPKSLMNQ